MSDYGVDPSLRRSSAIAISKRLWMHSSLKDVLKKCIDSNDSLKPKTAMHLPINEVITALVIPLDLKKELKSIVGAMGREIWDVWINCILTGSDSEEDGFVKGKASTFLDYLCWTVSGCVDIPETLRSLYFAGMLWENCTTWMKLCEYNLEDCLRYLWPKLSNEHQNRLGNSICDSFDISISTYWIDQVNCEMAFQVDALLALLYDMFSGNLYSLKEKMFLYSFIHNKYYAVKYFWDLLPENLRLRMMAHICEKINSNESDAEQYRCLFFSEMQVADANLLMFFLEQISHYGYNDMRIQILGWGPALAKLLEWPYGHLFMGTLRESLSHHDSVDYDPIMSRIFLQVCYCTEYCFIDVDDKYRNIFYEIWRMNPNNLKNSIDYANDLAMLWEYGDVELLNHILRDEELKNRRKDLLDICWRRRRNVNHAFIRKFAREVLISEEEQRLFLPKTTWSGKINKLLKGKKPRL